MPPGIAALVALLLLACACPAAYPTTKGLSQIVTPDLQPPGSLSLSAQAQARVIGNPWQLQAELGLTDWAELAVFQGFSPDEQILNAEFGLLRNQPLLLSAGFLNWSTRGGSAQPFIEAGWYEEHSKLMAGLQRIGASNEALLGYAWDFNPRWRVQADYLGGSDNSITLGVTWTPNERWQVNPALYRSNDSAHAYSGYLVVTYTIALWEH